VNQRLFIGVGNEIYYQACVRASELKKTLKLLTEEALTEYLANHPLNVLEQREKLLTLQEVSQLLNLKLPTVRARFNLRRAKDSSFGIKSSEYPPAWLVTISEAEQLRESGKPGRPNNPS